MNAALNASLDSIEGDLLVKTDDDVLPCPDWLLQYRQAADTERKKTVFGGTVTPEWPGRLPPWLTEWAANFGILYASSSRPTGACPLSQIYGPNWAVRTEVFADGTRFDERIGPDNTQVFYPMGGETEFFSRLKSKGHLGWFVSQAEVRHIIRPEQITEHWILDRAYRNGLGVGLTCPPDCASGPQIAGMPLRLLLRIVAYSSLARLARPLPTSTLRLRILFRNSWFAGLGASVRNIGAAHLCSEMAGIMTPETQTRPTS
jgi:hypothetical protein